MNKAPQDNNRCSQIECPAGITSWPAPQVGLRRASLEQKIHILDYYHALSFLQRRIVAIFRPYVKISTTSFCEWVKNETELRNRYHRGSSAVTNCIVTSQAEHNHIIDSRHSPAQGLLSCVSNGTETDISYYSPAQIPNEQPQPKNIFPAGTLALMRSLSEPQASSHYQPNVSVPVQGVLHQVLDYSHLTGLAPLSFGLDFGACDQIYQTTSGELGLSTDASNLGPYSDYSSIDQMSYGSEVQNDAAFDFGCFTSGKTSMDDTYVTLDHDVESQYRAGGDYRYTTSAPASTHNDFPTHNIYGDGNLAMDLSHQQNNRYVQHSIGDI